jgi:hypothetical protein
LKTGNFSAIYEAEDAFFEDKPLKPNRKKGAASTDPKYQTIEEEFKDYDYTRAVNEEERRARLQQLEQESKQLEEQRQEEKLDLENVRTLGEDALVNEDDE